jgi:hypothetical protein
MYSRILKINTHKINLLIIFFITFTFYGYFIRPLDWNSASRLSLVRAVVEEGRFAIDTYQQGEFTTGDKAYFNGHYYSDKAIGTAILGIIAYFPIFELSQQPLPTQLFIMLVTIFALSIPCALIAPLLYSITLQVVKEKWVALLISLCIALATPLLPYAGSFYGHTLASVLAFSVFSLWIKVKQFNQPITLKRIALSGFLISFMVLTEYTTFIIATVLIGYIAFIIRKQGSRNWSISASFFAGSLIPFILFAFYNWVCFGSPFTIGYANPSLPEFQELHGRGFMGIALPDPTAFLYMLIHPTVGLFFVSPILFISFIGMKNMYQNVNWRAEFIVAVLIILLYFLAISGFGSWWGGDSFMARYIIPPLPFFAIFLFFVPQKYQILMVGLGIISFFQMLVASATPFDYVGQHIGETIQKGFFESWNSSLFYDVLLPRFFKHKLNFTWGDYLLNIDSWYFNMAIPLIIFMILLIIFYVVNKRAEKI